MEKELIIGAIIAASLQVAFDRLASRPVLNFFRRRKLDELRKLKEKLLFSVNSSDKVWINEVKNTKFDAEDPLNKMDYEFFECEFDEVLQSESQTATSKEALEFHQPFSNWIMVERIKQKKCGDDNSCEIVEEGSSNMGS